MTGELDLEAAEFVLGTLDPAERDQFAARLTGDTEAQAAVVAWEARFADLANGVSPVAPGSHVWPKIERSLSAETAAPLRFKVIQGGATGDATAALRRSLKRWRAAAMISSAIAAALLIFAGTKLDIPGLTPGGPETTYVAAVNRGGDQPALIVRVDLKTHSVYVRPVAAETPKGKSLELWYISDGKPPRSMGLVDARPISAKLPAGTDAQAATFAVSVEPQGGSPTGTATGPIIYSGQLVKE